MRRATLMPSLLLGAALAGGTALASEPADLGPASVSLAGATVDRKAEGRVTEYIAGKTLTIRTDDQKSYTVKLDERDTETNVAPGLAVGARARIVESHDADGKRSLSVTIVTEAAANRKAWDR